jgi:hypothetical protein
VADKSTPLVLAALSRAAAAEAVPMHGTKTAPGLFPTTAAGKQAAQRCQDEGFLSTASEASPPTANGEGTATAVKKKAAAPCCVITDKGLSYLLSQLSPRQVLEDFVRVLEGRHQLLAEWAAAAQKVQASAQTLQAHVQTVLTRFPSAERASGAAGGLKALFREFLADQAPTPTAQDAPKVEAPLQARMLAELQNWQSSAASEDCPLPHLYRQVAPQTSATIGLFHDALRRLHSSATIYLHPWTGPLYELPEPPFALLVGHEIAYYASLRGKDEG